MKRKLFCAVLLAGMLCGSVAALADGGDITITVDGEKLVMDTQPVQRDSRTLVPFRAAAEKLGAQVSWDGEKKSVTCKKGGNTVVLTVDSNIMLKNSNAVRLDTKPVIVDGRVLVPVRALSEGLGARVSWYAEERLIVIRTDLTVDKAEESDGEAEVEIKTVSVNYPGRNGDTVFRLEYEMPEVVSGGSAAELINKNISANIEYNIRTAAEEFAQEAELAADIAAAQHTTMPARSLTGTARVTYNDNDTLSLVMEYTAVGSDFDFDGVHSDKLILPLVYNTKTGENIELKEYVSTKAVTKAKSKIIAEIKKNENGFRDEYVSLINAKEPKFYITDKGVTFVYDAGYLGKASKGAVSCILTFDELAK